MRQDNKIDLGQDDKRVEDLSQENKKAVDLKQKINTK